MPRLNANLVYQTPAQQSGLCNLAAYLNSMPCAHCTSRQWNNLKFLN